LSPQKVENTLCKSHLIHQACVFGDEKEYLVAVVKPNMELAHQNGYSKQDMIDLVGSAIAGFAHTNVLSTTSTTLMSYETPRKFLLIHEPFTRDNGMINVGDKTVRGEVYKRYQVEIDALYSPEAVSRWEGVSLDETKPIVCSPSSAMSQESSHVPVQIPSFQQVLVSLNSFSEAELDMLAKNIEQIKKRQEI